MLPLRDTEQVEKRRSGSVWRSLKDQLGIVLEPFARMHPTHVPSGRSKCALPHTDPYKPLGKVFIAILRLRRTALLPKCHTIHLQPQVETRRCGHSCRSVLPRPGNKMGKVDRSIDRDISAISQLVHVDVIRVTRINVLVDAFQDHTEPSLWAVSQRSGIRAASC